MSNYLLDAALALAARNVPVFPCDPQTKHPLPPADLNSEGKKIQGTGGHKKATTDAKQITTWWTRWPGAAIGMPTGLPETADVCDLDNKNGKNGFAAIPDWESLSPMIVATPSDGRHLHFKSTSTLRSTTSQLGQGVDTRGVGGYVIVPPSPGYKFIKGNFGCLGALPPWPEKYSLPEREPAAEHVSSSAATAPIGKIAVALQHVPNNDVDWETWNTIGMAIFRATDGDPDGLDLFDRWSQRSTKYDFDNCLARWEHWSSSSPPTKIGAGTLFQMADKAGTGWRDEPSARPAAEDEFDFVELLECPSMQPTDNAAAKAGFWIDMRAWIGQPIPERLWDVDDRVPRQTVGNLSGEGGVGKSILELTRNVAHTLGAQWLGAQCRQGPTFYLGAEDSEDELHIRIAAICEHFMVSFEDLVAGGMYVKSLLGQDACLCEQNRNGKVITTQHYSLLREMAGDLKPVNISLDPLTRIYPGNEIDRAAAYQFVAHMQALTNVSGGSVTVLSHPSLTGISTGSGTSGSTGWHGAYRFRQYLTAVKTSSGKESDPDLRELQIKKVQYGRQGERLVLRYQRGVFVPVTDDSPEVIQRAAEAEDVFMALLRRATAMSQKVSPKSAARNYAPRLFAEEQEGLFIGEDAFEAAMKRLFKAERIRAEEYGRPSDPSVRIVANEQQ